MHPNLKAFLDVIAASEIGPDLLAVTDNGYNVVVGSTVAHPILFSPYDTHPHRRVWFAKINDYSTAAGRYQILGKYYDAYAAQMHLPDFSPNSQDLIALKMITECKAIEDIVAGRIPVAIAKCSSRWASLPGANYPGQHMNKLDFLLSAYSAAGGSYA